MGNEGVMAKYRNVLWEIVLLGFQVFWLVGERIARDQANGEMWVDIHPQLCILRYTALERSR